MIWKYWPLGYRRTHRTKQQAWTSEKIRPVERIKHIEEVASYLNRVMKFMEGCTARNVCRAATELDQIESLPFYLGARLFCLRTGLEITSVAMHGNRPLLTSNLMINLLAGSFHFDVRNLRGLYPIMSHEGPILHVAADCDIERAIRDDHCDMPARSTFQAEVYGQPSFNYT